MTLNACTSFTEMLNIQEATPVYNDRGVLLTDICLDEILCISIYFAYSHKSNLTIFQYGVCLYTYVYN